MKDWGLRECRAKLHPGTTHLYRCPVCPTCYAEWKSRDAEGKIAMLALVTPEFRFFEDLIYRGEVTQ